MSRAEKSAQPAPDPEPSTRGSGAETGLRLVLLRHGESVWNEQGLFTGWVDVGLSERGAREAERSGTLLAEWGLLPDVVHTSLLARGIRTAEIALAEAGRHWIPVRRSWRLNERHYGALQGKSKQQIRHEFGEAQFLLWRRSYDVPPPPLEPDSELGAERDPRYRLLAPDLLPRSECLADVVERVLPYWHDAVVPELRAGKTVLVSAHGNSLRALVKHLDAISDDEIAEVNIPTGIPLLYELGSRLEPRARVDPQTGVSGVYLDPAAAATSIGEVRDQGRPSEQRAR